MALLHAGFLPGEAICPLVMSAWLWRFAVAAGSAAATGQGEFALRQRAKQQGKGSHAWSKDGPHQGVSSCHQDGVNHSNNLNPDQPPAQKRSLQLVTG